MGHKTMAKQGDIIQKLAQTQEERLLLARVLEKADICRERCYPTYKIGRASCRERV